MKDSFCTPYTNPRTGTVTSGGAARNGRIKTLGGMDNIIEKITEKVTKAVTLSLLDEADQNNKTG